MKWMNRIALISGLVLLSVCSVTEAQTTVSRTISINFGAEEPNGAGSAVALENGPAGFSGTVLWNNTTGASGSMSNLLEGNSGEDTFATVEWQSANTWASQGRGEENNSAPPGNDRNLMTGYLDSSDVSTTTVTLSNLDFDGPYSVLVYAKGGVNGRAGDYTIGSQTIRHKDTAAFNGVYAFTQDDTGAETGDVFIFSGVTGSSFTLSAKAASDIGGFRAPINAIEISGQKIVPEPSTAILAFGSLMGIFAAARRRLS